MTIDTQNNSDIANPNYSPVKKTAQKLPKGDYIVTPDGNKPLKSSKPKTYSHNQTPRAKPVSGSGYKTGFQTSTQGTVKTNNFNGKSANQNKNHYNKDNRRPRETRTPVPASAEQLQKLAARFAK